MKPKQIKIINKEALYIKWDNEEEMTISLKYLRDECPCANCKGETILLKTYRPPKIVDHSPEMYKIEKIEPVGNYAIQIIWKDGHNTGIYSWEYLQKLNKDQKDGLKQNYQPLI
ncbi:MAG: DUF971 domain-containing protein [Ignavibacterium sp.]|nr:DUF971 domain-containing protein [Ignavibacterium sp.]MCX7611910.1 DUF971 domain-containing protein [Ignavibacterium sp.]MDW8374970.1 DUF971 domain-containing protein [Ignavibacteriales bacterium]